MLRQAVLSFPLLVAGATALAQPNPLPVYLVAEFEVIDSAGFQKFGEATTPLVKAHGGEFLSRRNKITPVVGDPPKNVTIISFPSLEKAQAYFESAEYKTLIANRDKSSKFRSYLVQGGDLAQR
jgi:uncharacterized protein (DUF1330 family)